MAHRLQYTLYYLVNNCFRFIDMVNRKKTFVGRQKSLFTVIKVSAVLVKEPVFDED